MAMKSWGRRWGAAATSVCVALTTNGCVQFVSTTRNEDVMVESKPVSQPTGEHVYSATLSADAGQPVTVRALQQDLCALSEHQVIDRTVITQTEPEGLRANALVGILGVAGMAGGTVMGVQGWKDAEDTKKEKLQLGGALFALGAYFAGTYVYQEVRSGESRRHVGKQERELAQGKKPCGPQTPARQLEIKLVNREAHSEIVTRTDDQGQVVIPEAEVAKLDAPVDMYVAGSSVGFSRAAVERGQAAAMGALEKACGSGDARSCVTLGMRFRTGQGVPKDDARAAALLKKGCDAGDAEGCAQLGASYLVGLGVPQDRRRGFALLEKACDGGVAKGCFLLGVRYDNGDGVPKDERRAAAMYEKACKGGEAGGCGLLALAYGVGRGVSKDPSRAIELHEKACDGGMSPNCSILGGYYAEGKGVAKNPTHAAELYDKACDGGNAVGCFELGRQYLLGMGIPQDEGRGVELLEKACEKGHGEGCFIGSGLYLQGRGVPRNLGRSVALLEKGCAADHANCCFYLGSAYMEGALDLHPDPARGAELKERALKLGYREE